MAIVQDCHIELHSRKENEDAGRGQVSDDTRKLDFRPTKSLMLTEF